MVAEDSLDLDGDTRESWGRCRDEAKPITYQNFGDETSLKSQRFTAFPSYFDDSLRGLHWMTEGDSFSFDPEPKTTILLGPVGTRRWIFSKHNFRDLEPSK